MTSAASGLLAWGLLVAQTCQFDIVLTEVVMPGLSGIGLLSRIMARETLKHIPVVSKFLLCYLSVSCHSLEKFICYDVSLTVSSFFLLSALQ